MVKYRSHKLVQKKKKEFQVKVFLFLIIFVCLVFVSSQISKINYINIQKIDIFGNKTINSNEIKIIIDNDMKGNFLKVFSKRNCFLYSKNKIKEDLLNKFSKIDTLKVYLILPNTLKIEIVERKPYAFWCNKDKLETCFFIDNKGYIFSKYKKLVDYHLFFKYYSNLKNPKNIITNYIFGQKNFKEIDSFVKFVKDLNLKPQKFIVKNNGDYELYYGNGSKILFNQEQDTKEVIKNFKLILNTKEFKNTDFIKNLDYLDLRFGNKVFYK